MKLYSSTSSPNARRVRVFLAEKNLDVEIVNINLGEKEQFGEQYRAVSPRSQVPALQLDDGAVIGEVPAIWRYIEETHAATPLLGTTPLEKAQIAMWERRMELDGFAAVMEAVRNAIPFLTGRALSGPHAYEQIPALAERSRLRVDHFYADLNARLNDTAFVAGAQFSAADITAVVTIDFAAGALKQAIPAGFTALQRWYDTVSARPSFKA